jgi:acyl CoA:acetate/3-ketoacid CoA transferase beta subunit
MNDVTRAEICAAAISDNFRGDGEILVSCFGNVPSVGARLAKSTHAPDLLLTDGIASLVDGVQPVSGKRDAPVVEAWMPFRSVFDLLWSGRRHVVMMASQVDRYGNQNFSAVGAHAKPAAQLIGMRGAPGNTISHPTSYWVPNHSKQTFVASVDVVCGVGYDRAAKLSPQ